MQDPSSLSAAAFPQLPEHEQLRCPRCDSSNTKFCYYNNYNLSQPRHFCKNCKRYWTKGGSLRNIPVGGGSRKNTKRSSKQQRSVQISSTSLPLPSVSGSGSGSSPSQNPSLKAEPVPMVLGTIGTDSDTPAESFSSLLGLASDGQFGNLLHGFGQDGPKSGSSDGSGQNLGLQLLQGNGGSSEGFMMGGLQNGGEASSCWVSSNGWPDLAIYTPAGSKFQ